MFECGFYEKEITPPLGLLIPGYFNERPGANVTDRLYAKAMVVKSEENTVAIAVVDACSFPLRLTDQVIARVAEFAPIPADNIMVCADHTHTGGPIYQGENHAWRNEEYENYVVKLIADCIVLAYLRLEKANLKFGMGEVTSISFVRDYVMKDGTYRTNPGRLNPMIDHPVTDIDPQLPVLFVESENGVPLGALTCFACHQDCVDQSNYSADFSGSLAKEMKKTYGQDFVNLFLLGTCGDINHFNVKTAGDAPDHFMKMGRIVAGEELKTINEAETLSGTGVASKKDVLKIDRRKISPERLAEAKHIKATVKPAVGVKIAADNTDPEQYALAMANNTLRLAALPEVLDVVAQTLRIGDLVLYCFPGEVFSCFGKQIKANTEAKHCMVATLCNDNITGYIPREDLFVPGIYEAVEGSANMIPEGGKILTEKLLEMGKAL